MQACDGLFVDYHWNDTSCRTACDFLEGRKKGGGCTHSPAEAWFGVDVYGRGTFGGGGWNTDIAVAHAGAHGAPPTANPAVTPCPGLPCRRRHFNVI